MTLSCKEKIAEIQELIYEYGGWRYDTENYKGANFYDSVKEVVEAIELA